MKALDTGVILALLEGSAKARELVRKLRGAELATTEVNLLELGYLATQAPAKARSARIEALERLRQRLTVLPQGSRATSEALARVRKGPEALSPLVAQMLGALEAAGCEELITDDPRAVSGDWRFRVRTVRL